MTFSIVARDPATGDLGIAVASKFLAVGAVVPWAQAGVGAVATQALANVRYGPDGLAFLAAGKSAADALDALTQADDGRDHRQAGIVHAAGGSASYTGSGCIPWAGGRTADGVAAQGNLLAGPSVVDALIETYLAGGAAFPELLMRAMKAADDQGGDRRGRQSAALLIVREGGGYAGGNDRWIDLRVDEHPAPIDELSRILDVGHLLLDRPAEADLLPIDDAIATEMRGLLPRVGYDPRNLDLAKGLARIIEDAGVERTGTPRDVPESWDSTWEAALAEWMSVENLEARFTASGWIDPRVLEHLRRNAG